jgi:hypothetical protein
LEALIATRTITAVAKKILDDALCDDPRALLSGAMVDLQTVSSVLDDERFVAVVSCGRSQTAAIAPGFSTATTAAPFVGTPDCNSAPLDAPAGTSCRIPSTNTLGFAVVAIAAYSLPFCPGVAFSEELMDLDWGSWEGSLPESSSLGGDGTPLRGAFSLCFRLPPGFTAGKTLSTFRPSRHSHRHDHTINRGPSQFSFPAGGSFLPSKRGSLFVSAEVVGIEPVLNEEARRDTDGEHAGHEGELTAARRLIDSLQTTYGTFIDALVLDALYANGPLMTQLDRHGYGAFIVLKKENNEPLKEALALFQSHAPCEDYYDADKKERIQFWDVDDIETLDSYKGKVRVIRAVITKPDKEPTTWCVAIIGKRARKLARRTALQIIRSRWHVENTAFNQWIQYWNLGHVFRHTANALLAVLLLWALAFNLLQLFIYRRLGRCRRPKDPTDTIRHIVEVMLRDLATLPEPIPWTALLDTS